MRKDTTPRDKSCLDWGLKVLQGSGHSMTASHLNANYEHYARLTTVRYPEREVFVVRTNQLWDDLLHLDRLLGGTGGFPNQTFFTHNSENYDVKGTGRPLSGEALVAVCCTMWKELQLYESLLIQAVNLAQCEKDNSLWQLRRQCQMDHLVSWSDWEGQTCQGLATGSQ